MSKTDFELTSDWHLFAAAKSKTPASYSELKDGDPRFKIYGYFIGKGGGVASSVVQNSPMCGTKHGRKSRLKRAKQIRASHVAELQAAGLLPIGTLFWLWWSSPIGWRFLLNWIMEILTETEGPDT
jgi:hypothetical protein